MDRGARFGIVVALALGGCNWLKSNQPDGATATNVTTAQRRLQRTCASNATYDRLKVAMFEKAAQIRGGRADALDQLEAATFVRMESPLVKSRDEALNVTVCTGRFVLELPEGAVRVFNGERRLTADIEYSAQQAIDNSGLVYQMQGAEPIVYRLAALDAGQRTARADVPPGPAVATRNDTPSPPTPAPPPPELPVVRDPAPIATPPRPAPVPRRETVQRDTASEITERETLRRQAAMRREVVRREAIQRETVQREAVRRAVLVEAEPEVRTARSRPSFDCDRARLRVHVLICGSDRLAAADRLMSATFFRALAVADPDSRARLRQSRDRFLAYRNRCSSEACIEQAYADRIDEIRDLSEPR